MQLLPLRTFPKMAEKLLTYIGYSPKAETMKVFIHDILHSNSAVFHKEGLAVYPVIDECLRNNVAIEVSFANIETCSTQFLNACIGKAYLSFPSDQVKSLLKVVDYAHMSLFESKLQNVISNALNYHEYNSIVDGALA